MDKWIEFALSQDIPSGFRIRTIDQDDCDLIYRWATDESVRENGFNPEPIIYEEHLKWFDRKLRDINTKIYIAYMNEIPVGQIRIELIETTGIIGYSIDFQHRGFGYGTLLLSILPVLLKTDNTYDCKKLLGRVKKSNSASQRAFIKAGYTEINGDYYFEYIREID